MDTFTSVALAIGAILLTVIYRTLYVEGSFTPAPVPAGRFKDDAKVCIFANKEVIFV